MIPYKLRLENFLSYREGLEALDFSGMHLVCLVGSNGHGKSALLDGITWALWGRARASSDDDLMHTGCSEMQVEFEFGLGGERYNVIRKRIKRGRSKKSELELAVWDESSAAWQPLTEPSIRATQARINAILRMDYDTFVHSAFLKQGEADAFTSKSPGQRKDILATILNLSRYDAYAEKAKMLAKEAEAEARLRQQRVNEIDEELAQRPRYEEELQKVTLVESQANLRRVETEKKVAELRLAVRDLAGKEAAMKELAQRTQDETRELAETEQAIQATEQRLHAARALLAKRETIESEYQLLQQAQVEEQRWSDVLQARRPLEEKQVRLDRKLQEARTHLERELAVIKKTLADLQERLDSLPALQTQAQQVKEEIEVLMVREAESKTRRERLATLAAERQRLAEEKARVKQEGDSLQERKRILIAGETNACPVCKQPLGPEGRQHLEDEYEAHLQELRATFRTLQKQEAEVSREEQEIRRQLQADERALRQSEPLRRQWAQIEARLADIETARTEIAAYQEKAEALAAKLAGDYAPEVQAALAEVQQQLAALPYDEKAHRQARATLADLRGLEREYAALEQAAQQEKTLLETLATLQARKQREEERLRLDQAKWQALRTEVAELATLQKELRELQARADEALAAWEKAQAYKIAAQQRLQACVDLEKTRKQQVRQLMETKERATRYQQLREAFGPRGVQALIIEAALPELETEANRLLARLSDGRMSVRLETQRELKSGGTRETLDIIISDELGSRPYELYSGGEAFRADLALRVALSRLLARRAGAALQTLFIDEGFGTQDAHGRENLIEAIHMIKDEFALVLVITHIDELKEHFPVRIQVVKEEGRGSRYYVT